MIINLNASTAAFVTELERVKNLSFDTATQVQRSFSLIGTAALGMLSVAAGAFAEGINKTAEWEEKILHLSESAGTTTEAMSGLSFAAKMMGLEIDQVASAMERFDKQLLQAQLGNAKSAQNMSLLGIDPSQIKTSDDALKALADHFAALPDGAVKSGEAMMAFGKAGAAMIPILNLGGKGIQDFMDQAKAMGIVISKDQAEQAEIFEQNVTRMQEALHGLWVETTNKALPAMNDLMAAWTKGGHETSFLGIIGGISAILTQGVQVYGAYKTQGEAIIAQQEKMRGSVQNLTADFATHQKAVDSLKKSVESIITTYQTNIATMGMTLLQTTEYKLRADAAKVGLQGWIEQMIQQIDQLDKEKTLHEQLALLNNQTIREQELIDTQNKRKALQEVVDVMGQQLDLVMKLQFSPTGITSPSQTTQAFTDSIDQQTAALEHQIATFGMSAEAIARYDLAQLDSGQAAQDQIAKFKARQDQLDAMRQHAKTTTDAWKQFGEVANRSLDDLIFSGKSFAQVLSDITKQLGEMFLKWALFGFGQSNTSGGRGLFGILSAGLSGLFPGHASGGSVSAGNPVIVGEQGPELFLPSTSGAIIPHGASIGGNASVNYYIDARGSSITEEQFRRSLALSEKRAVQTALSMSREISLRTA